MLALAAATAVGTTGPDRHAWADVAATSLSASRPEAPGASSPGTGADASQVADTFRWVTVRAAYAVLVPVWYRAYRALPCGRISAMKFRSVFLAGTAGGQGVCAARAA